MKPIVSIELLEAAAYALIGGRCRESYMHDLRGGVQAIQSAVELLVRAASKAGDSAGIADKAASLARRAVQNQEKSFSDLLGRLVPGEETAAPVNVADVVTDALRFLRNEAAGKPVTFHLETAGAPVVMAPPHRLRLLIVGLCTGMIDAAQAGASVDVKVGRAGGDALIEFKSSIPSPAVRTPAELWVPGGSLPSTYELLLALTRHWVLSNGGRLEPPADADLPRALRIYYPLANSNIDAADAAG